MLVALGAALTIMLSQYFNLMFEGPWKEIGDSLGIKTDVSRLGAQVINGVGFSRRGDDNRHGPPRGQGTDDRRGTVGLGLHGPLPLARASMSAC